RYHLARQRRGKIEFTTWLNPSKMPAQLHYTMASIDENRRRGLAFPREHPHHHAVARSESHVCDRQRRRHRRFELAIALRVAHRRTGVQENVGEKIFLFFEKLYVVFVGPAV